MRTVTKYLTGGIVMLALTILAFILSLRSCLSKYDERYALPPVMHFEKDGKEILFSLIKFSKTTSYSQEGGITTKTFSNNYFIQNNDAITGEKIADKKLEGHGIVKHFPEEVLGATNTTAWLFIDELMAFDAFTLQKVADCKMIEDKNPVLKTNMPEESRYYHFNNDHSTIDFTAKDGSLWQLNTTTLLASLQKEKIKPIKSNAFSTELKLKNLQRLNLGFNEMFINQDTAKVEWMGIYSEEEIEKLTPVISTANAYGQDVRRQLFTTTYNKTEENNFSINKKGFKNISQGEYFLDGGFLLNKQTEKAIVIPGPASHIIIYKSQVGAEGRLMLCRFACSGKAIWKLNTGISSWIDWSFVHNRLVIWGNYKTSGNSQCSLLLVVNLDSGIVKRYSYFSDKSNGEQNKDLSQTLQLSSATSACGLATIGAGQFFMPGFNYQFYSIN